MYLKWLFPQLKHMGEEMKESVMQQARDAGKNAYGASSKPSEASATETDEYTQDFPTQDLKLVEIDKKHRKRKHKHHHHHHYNSRNSHQSNRSHHSNHEHDSPGLKKSTKKIYKGEDSSGKGAEEALSPSPSPV